MTEKDLQTAVMQEDVERIRSRSPVHSNGSHLPRYNVLVLYDDCSTYVKTIEDYLSSFRRFSRHNIFYSSAVRDAICAYDLAGFDAIVLHYSVRLCFNHLSPSFAEKVRKAQALKVLFIQDEYDHTNNARQWIKKLGMDVVYTCVPPKYREAVYPRKDFPKVQFVHTLTGFVPLAAGHRRAPKPLQERKWLLGYRGRVLPYKYGNLAREKLVIGQRMRQICEERNLPVNIEWDDQKRIYGTAWFEFLRNCRAILGTESGSNVFDFDGKIAANIERALKEDPQVTYEEIHTRYLRDHDGKIVMNQVSPKIFEAIANRTALVLFEGTYSHVVQPGKHYIPLKKDFSNVDEVLSNLQDTSYLEQLTGRAHHDIIVSGKYSYKCFIERFDRLLFERLGVRECAVPLITLHGFSRAGREGFPGARPTLGLPPTLQLLSWSTPAETIYRGWWKTLSHPTVLQCLWNQMKTGMKRAVRFFLSPRRNLDRSYRLWKCLPLPIQRLLKPLTLPLLYLLRRRGWAKAS